MSKSSNSSTNQTTNTNSTLTSTPTNPDWVSGSVQGIQGQINNLLSANPQSFVAGPTALQTQGFSAASGLGGWQPSSLAAANAAAGLLHSTLTPQQAQAGTANTTNATTSSAAPTLASSGTLLDTNLDGYMNPYLKNVEQTTLQNMDQNAAATRAQLAASQARDQKFSGSGAAITSALTNQQLAMARATTDAQLRAAGYDTATSNATNDLNRSAATSALNAQLGTQTSQFNAGAANNTSQFNAGAANNTSQFNTNLGANNSQFNAGQANTLAQQQIQDRLAASGLLGDLSNATANNDRADLASLLGAGDDQRTIASQQAAAPLSLLSILSGLNSQQPYSLFHGSTNTENGTSNTNGTTNTTTTDPFGEIGGVLSGLGSVGSGLGALGVKISDKRLKTDIETVGRDKSGRRVVSYRYKGEPAGTNRIGYLAQEIEKTDPHAVVTLPGGYKAVNYGLLSEAA